MGRRGKRWPNYLVFQIPLPWWGWVSGCGNEISIAPIWFAQVWRCFFKLFLGGRIRYKVGTVPAKMSGFSLLSISLSFWVHLPTQYQSHSTSGRTAHGFQLWRRPPSNGISLLAKVEWDDVAWCYCSSLILSFPILPRGMTTFPKAQKPFLLEAIVHRPLEVVGVKATWQTVWRGI